MNLTELMASKKNAIVDQWFTRVVDTYPAETARFLRSQTDPFANPVGRTTLDSLRTLVDLLCGGFEIQAARKALDPILRIRAIQDFTPAQATRFVFDLKDIVRELTPADRQTQEEMRHFDQRIDEMALAAFDIYMQCREKILDLKATEMKSSTYKAFARAGLIKEPGDD